MPNHIELSRRAERDLRGVTGDDRRRIIRALREDLTAEPPAENLDIVPLRGREPWLRMRVGDWRILFRPLTPAEFAQLGDVAGDAERGYLVARIVNRRDLERAVETLPSAV